MRSFKEFMLEASRSEALPFGMSVAGVDSTGSEPDRIEYDEDGRVIIKEWMRNGHLHRDGDKPSAMYYRWEDDKLVGLTIIWTKNGIITRQNKPAKIVYGFEFFDEIGDSTTKAQKRSRVDYFYNNGKLVGTLEASDSRGHQRWFWYKDGDGYTHNLKGPAMGSYDLLTGNANSLSYCIHGKYYTPEEFKDLTNIVDIKNIDNVLEIGDLF